MTREEAIRWFKESPFYHKDHEPFNMAINALEQEPTTKNDLGVDCISRKAALSNEGLFEFRYYDDYLKMREYLENLPSVTPQEPQSFKWCETCKEYDTEKHCCHRYSKVIRDTVAEIRQEPKTGHWKLVQRGKAIDVCCSNCGAVRIKGYAYNYTIDELNKEDINECCGSAEMRYCPSCGSDNREVEK